MKTILFPITIALFFVTHSLPAQVQPGNFWPNPTFEAGSGGAPDFWRLGGSDTSVLQWSTANSVSPTHSLGLIDNSLGFGEWYSGVGATDFALAGSASAGQTINIRWSEIYHLNNNAPDGNQMRVTVRFLDASFNGPDNHFVVTGDSSGWNGSLATSTWTLRNQQLVVPADVFGGVNNPTVYLRIALVSGGNQALFGQYIIDDLSVAVVPEPSTIALLSVGGVVGLSVLRRRKIAR